MSVEDVSSVLDPLVCAFCAFDIVFEVFCFFDTFFDVFFDELSGNVDWLARVTRPMYTDTCTFCTLKLDIDQMKYFFDYLNMSINIPLDPHQ